MLFFNGKFNLFLNYSWIHILFGLKTSIKLEKSWKTQDIVFIN